MGRVLWRKRRGTLSFCTREVFVSGGEAGQLASADEDSGEHGSVQAAGVGVAQGWVIAGEQMDAVGHGVFGSVGEAEGGPGADDLCVKEVSQEAVPGDLSEADDDPNASQGGELVGEVLAAVTNLLREGLVAGRSAADDGGDPGVAKFEPIVARGAGGLVGEAEFVEDGVHEVSGAVAGKRTTGAVGTMGAGSESKDQDAGAWIPEARNGTGPVGLIEVGTAAGFADGGAEGAQARTTLAEDDLLPDLLKLSLFGEGWHAC